MKLSDFCLAAVIGLLGCNPFRVCHSDSDCPSLQRCDTSLNSCVAYGQFDGGVDSLVEDGGIVPRTLTYTSTLVTYTKGLPIPENAPSSEGGAVDSYSVSPALPQGLAIDASTGVIAGTPTAVTATGHYTVTATSRAGTTSVTLTITVNDVPPPALYRVSGDVSGLIIAGVTVRLSSASLDTTVTTDASGHFAFDGVTPGSYTLTPSLAGGYTFAPTTLSVEVNKDVTVQSFTSAGAHGISGTVSGVAVVGVTVQLSGATSATTATDAAGHYGFAGLANGTYTVTPSLAGGYLISPASRQVILTGASATSQDFVSAGAYSITGAVTGLVVAGVTMTLAIGATNVATATTDASGKYGFAGLPNGSYSLAPSRAGGYVFSPAAASVVVNGANVTGRSFTSAGAYSVSGSITGLLGGGVSGVTVTLSLGETTLATTTSDASGRFSFSALANGSYTVKPTGAGILFGPESATATVKDQSVSGLDFWVVV